MTYDGKSTRNLECGMFWSYAVQATSEICHCNQRSITAMQKLSALEDCLLKMNKPSCFVAEARQLGMQCEHVLWWAWVISSHQFGSPWWINLLFQDKKESTVSALSVVTAEVNDEITGTAHEELYWHAGFLKFVIRNGQKKSSFKNKGKNPITWAMNNYKGMRSAN